MSDLFFTMYFEAKSEEVYEIAKSKGWHKNDRNEGELILLTHCELSEAVEAMREGNPQSEKIPGFTSVEEELADVVIRIMDMAQDKGYRVGDAIVEKVKYNKTRPHMHGGKRF